MIKTIFFDLGNVLLKINNRAIVSWVREMCAHSENPKRDYDDAMNFLWRELHDNLNAGKLTPRQFYEKLCAYFNIEFNEEEVWKVWKSLLYPWDEMLAFGARLAKKYETCLVSNTNEVHWDYCMQTIPQLKFLHHYVLSHEVGVNKPDPLIYRRALEVTGAKPEEVVFMDDIQENIDGAAALGINTILAKDFPQIAADLRAYGVTAD